MSLPISWVVAGAMPATQALKLTANLAGTSASHFFGELLQKSPPPQKQSAVDSGRSEQIEPTQTPKSIRNDGKSLTDRIQSLRSSLSKFVNESRVRLGLGPGTGKTEGISITSNGKETPRLSGPEPLRTELEIHLRENPAIVQEINAVALQKSSAGPLRLLPTTSSEIREPQNEPWTLWVD